MSVFLSVCLSVCLSYWLADWLTGSGGMLGVRRKEGEGAFIPPSCLASPGAARQLGE